MHLKTLLAIPYKYDQLLCVYMYHRTTVSTRNGVPLTVATAPSFAQTSHHTTGSHILSISSITVYFDFTIHAVYFKLLTNHQSTKATHFFS